MEKWRRLFIVIGGFIEALLFSGCLFGWTSLVHVLQQEGVYFHLCKTNNVTLNAFEEPTMDGFSMDFQVANTRNLDWSDNLTSDPNPINFTTTLDDLEADTSASGERIYRFDNDKGYGSSTSTPVDDHFDGNTSSHLEEHASSVSSDHVVKRCPEQDETFNLIYVIASVNYGLCAFIVGFCLDKIGLLATRVVAGLMTTGGFFCLAFTSKEIPWLLWPALNLISLGTIQLRQSSFQFANAFPRRRATILTAYSAAYSISTILFLLIQYSYKGGFSYQTSVLVLTGISTFTLPFTLIMPKMKIEDQSDENRKDAESNESSMEKRLCKQDAETEEDAVLQTANDGTQMKSGQKNTEGKHEKVSSDPDELLKSSGANPREDSRKGSISVKESLFTLSAALHLHWHFINFFMVLFYSATFIPWAYKITDDVREVTFFNEISGLCQLIAPAFIPVAGFITDALTKRASQYEDRVERKAAQLEAPAYALAVATSFLIALLTCKMFVTRPAIYASMVLIAISRPLVVGCCATYIRLRFPAEHFNLLFGIFTTIVSFFALSQFVLFKWMNQCSTNSALGHWLLMIILVTSLASPGHMLLRCLSRKYATRLLSHAHAN